MVDGVKGERPITGGLIGGKIAHTKKKPQNEPVPVGQGQNNTAPKKTKRETDPLLEAEVAYNKARSSGKGRISSFFSATSAFFTACTTANVQEEMAGYERIRENLSLNN